MKHPPRPSIADVRCAGPCDYCAEHFGIGHHDWRNLDEKQRCRLLLGHARHLNRHTPPPKRNRR